MDNSIKKDNLLQMVERQARKNLQGYITENQIGYNGFLIDEMKKIFLKKGIDWEPLDNSILSD